MARRTDTGRTVGRSLRLPLPAGPPPSSRPTRSAAEGRQPNERSEAGGSPHLGPHPQPIRRDHRRCTVRLTTQPRPQESPVRSSSRLAPSTSSSWSTSGVAPEAPLTGEAPAVNRAPARFAYPGQGPSSSRPVEPSTTTKRRLWRPALRRVRAACILTERARWMVNRAAGPRAPGARSAHSRRGPRGYPSRCRSTRARRRRRVVRGRPRRAIGVPRAIAAGASNPPGRWCAAGVTVTPIGPTAGAPTAA